MLKLLIGLLRKIRSWAHLVYVFIWDCGQLPFCGTKLTYSKFFAHCSVSWFKALRQYS